MTIETRNVYSSTFISWNWYKTFRIIYFNAIYQEASVFAIPQLYIHIFNIIIWYHISVIFRYQDVTLSYFLSQHINLEEYGLKRWRSLAIFILKLVYVVPFKKNLVLLRILVEMHLALGCGIDQNRTMKHSFRHHIHCAKSWYGGDSSWPPVTDPRIWSDPQDQFWNQPHTL